MLINEITPHNILSFGPNTDPIELGPLNIIIGANGSGKSNLLSVISLLAAAPTDILKPIIQGGGFDDWRWKGLEQEDELFVEIEITPNENNKINHDFFIKKEHPLKMAVSEEISLNDKIIYNTNKEILNKTKEKINKYNEIINTNKGLLFQSTEYYDEINKEQSVINQFTQTGHYSEGLYIYSKSLMSIKIFKDWRLDKNGPIRSYQRTDQRASFLEEDASNLSQYLAYLGREDPGIKSKILSELKEFYDGITDYNFEIIGGMTQIYFTERNKNISAMRLSDGTLRYLCLLAILCNPNPPRLICLEEPETGLHPDILPNLAKLLKEASTRTQIIVTTHSDILVDAMTDTPEAVMVAEKHDGCTQITRLDPEKLKPWLEKYRLGNLWSSGKIGGNRW